MGSRGPMISTLATMRYRGAHFGRIYGLISIGTVAATNAHSADARRIFDHALKSAQEIESPIGGNSVMADIALRQLELGFQAESQKTLTFITHAGVKAELVKKLARLKPASARL